MTLFGTTTAYYVFGWSESHGKIIKFRVDRMVHPKESELGFHEKTPEYNIKKICKEVFSMYDGEECTVSLRCDNSVMKDIVDRFGEDVKTTVLDDYSFLAEVTVSVSQTFFAWASLMPERYELLVRRRYVRTF